MDGAEPAVVLTAVRRLAQAAVEDAAAAREVAWESAAATRFREEVTTRTRLLAARLDAVDHALRQVGGLS